LGDLLFMAAARVGLDSRGWMKSMSFRALVKKARALNTLSDRFPEDQAH
jgi:hypothetical protein